MNTINNDYLSLHYSSNVFEKLVPCNALFFLKGMQIQRLEIASISIILSNAGFFFVAAIPLNVEDIRMILHMTWDYREVWKPIGIELGIHKDVLNAIEDKNSDDMNCLIALIKKWLNGASLTGTARDALDKTLQSQNIINALAGLFT